MLIMFNQILSKFAHLVVVFICYSINYINQWKRRMSRGGIVSSMSPLNDSLIVHNKQTGLFHIEHCFRPDLP